MSEPRYDFLLAVLRRRTLIGYALVGVSVIYNPQIPQDNSSRREYVGDKYLLSGVERELCIEHGLPVNSIEFEREGVPKNGVILWGVVPILGVYSTVVKKISGYSLPDGEVNFLLSQEFIRKNRLEKWFEEMCTQLHKLGGGKYMITRVQKPEVPRFAL